MPAETNVVGILFRRATIFCSYFALVDDTLLNKSREPLRFFSNKAKRAAGLCADLARVAQHVCGDKVQFMRIMTAYQLIGKSF